MKASNIEYFDIQYTAERTIIITPSNEIMIEYEIMAPNIVTENFIGSLYIEIIPLEVCSELWSQKFYGQVKILTILPTKKIINGFLDFGKSLT